MTSVIWVINTNSSSMISVPISVSISVFVSQPMAVHLPALPPPPQANSFALASQSVVPVVLLSLLHRTHQSTRTHLPMIFAIIHQIVIVLSAQWLLVLIKNLFHDLTCIIKPVNFTNMVLWMDVIIISSFTVVTLQQMDQVSDVVATLMVQASLAIILLLDANKKKKRADRKITALTGQTNKSQINVLYTVLYSI